MEGSHKYFGSYKFMDSWIKTNWWTQKENWKSRRNINKFFYEKNCKIVFSKTLFFFFKLSFPNLHCKHTRWIQWIIINMTYFRSISIIYVEFIHNENLIKCYFFKKKVEISCRVQNSLENRRETNEVFVFPWLPWQNNFATT